MRICIKIGDRTWCFNIPILLYPLHPPKPDPEKEYGELIYDATILASVNAAAKQLSDAGVREALNTGVAHAVAAAQKKAGANVTLSLER
ncbi:MAG TPA: hypothetical protein VHE33_18850 [Acidobacteriaceae bacterium]|jgi:hypothetical protein|nr:hypothetical protein [Acidobacteriaceae bacterium]